MGKPIKVYQVKKMNTVDTSKYVEGSLFITDRSAALLINGQLKTLSTRTPSLKDYVKKDEVKKMIEDYLKEGETVEKKTDL